MDQKLIDELSSYPRKKTSQIYAKVDLDRDFLLDLDLNVKDWIEEHIKPELNQRLTDILKDVGTVEVYSDDSRRLYTYKKMVCIIPDKRAFDDALKVALMTAYNAGLLAAAHGVKPTWTQHIPDKEIEDE